MSLVFFEYYKLPRFLIFVSVESLCITFITIFSIIVPLYYTLDTILALTPDSKKQNLKYFSPIFSSFIVLLVVSAVPNISLAIFSLFSLLILLRLLLIYLPPFFKKEEGCYLEALKDTMPLNKNKDLTEMLLNNDKYGGFVFLVFLLVFLMAVCLMLGYQSAKSEKILYQTTYDNKEYKIIRKTPEGFLLVRKTSSSEYNYAIVNENLIFTPVENDQSRKSFLYKVLYK